MNGYRPGTRWLIPALVCAVLACACSTQDQGGQGSTGGIRTVQGSIVAIDLTQMAVDGPGLVRVEPDDGKAVDLLVSACEGPCSIQANETLPTLSIGDRVRARGAGRDGELVIYDDELHFIEVLE